MTVRRLIRRLSLATKGIGRVSHVDVAVPCFGFSRRGRERQEVESSIITDSVFRPVTCLPV